MNVRLMEQYVWILNDEELKELKSGSATDYVYCEESKKFAQD